VTTVAGAVMVDAPQSLFEFCPDIEDGGDGYGVTRTTDCGSVMP